MDIKIEKFRDIDINETFFDSLRLSYKRFNKWFNEKSETGESAYVFRDPEKGTILDFMYIKEENEIVKDVVPHLPFRKHLKVGTFKIEPRHTRRGERFMKKIMDYAIAKKMDDIYVTIFPTEKLQRLIDFFTQYGFEEKAKKIHKDGRIENVYVKDLHTFHNDVLKDYPFVNLADNKKWLLSIYPDYHTKLFPDSILKNENPYDLLQDVSETNSIHKIYICWMKDVQQMKTGDVVVIYRTSDGLGSAAYRSVASSVCVIEEIKTCQDFDNVDNFLEYSNKYSVFNERDLRNWYRYKNNLKVIKMTYNVAFRKKIIRKELIEKAHMDISKYWGVYSLTNEQFYKIIELGEANERYFID